MELLARAATNRLSAAALCAGLLAAASAEGDRMRSAAPGDLLLLQYRVEARPTVGLPPEGAEDPDDGGGDWMMDESFGEAWLSIGAAPVRVSAPSDAEAAASLGAHEDLVCATGGEEALGLRHIFAEKVQSLHVPVVREMRRSGRARDREPAPAERAAGAGEIAGLHTFGAPGTSIRPLTNPLSEDGKFPGVRVLMRRLDRFMGKEVEYHDPIGFLAALVNMKHPHMDALVLTLFEEQKPQYRWASSATSQFPRPDRAFWFKGHHQDTYRDELEHYRHDHDKRIHQMLFLARAVDPSINKHRRELCIEEAAKVGWKLVAQSTSDDLHHLDIIHHANTSLFQDPETHACALAWVPTHHTTHWLANLNSFRTTYCGIPNVHRGFRNQVRRVVRARQWQEEVRPALASCRELYVTGHSLGAAQANLVAACLQRAPAEGEEGWEDYQEIAWIPDADAPRSLPALS